MTDLERNNEDEYFYMSLRECVFDSYFTFSKRLEEGKDADSVFFQDAYDAFCQKKVYFIDDKEKIQFGTFFKNVVRQYYSAISNRVEEQPILCSIVRVISSLNSTISISTWLFYEFPSENLVGKKLFIRTAFVQL